MNGNDIVKLVLKKAGHTNPDQANLQQFAYLRNPSTQAYINTLNNIYRIGIIEANDLKKAADDLIQIFNITKGNLDHTDDMSDIIKVTLGVLKATEPVLYSLHRDLDRLETDWKSYTKYVDSENLEDVFSSLDYDVQDALVSLDHKTSRFLDYKKQVKGYDKKDRQSYLNRIIKDLEGHLNELKAAQVKLNSVKESENAGMHPTFGLYKKS